MRTICNTPGLQVRYVLYHNALRVIKGDIDRESHEEGMNQDRLRFWNGEDDMVPAGFTEH